MRMVVRFRPVFCSLPSHGVPSIKLRILENLTLYLRNSWSLNLRAIENCTCGLRSIGREMRFIFTDSVVVVDGCSYWLQLIVAADGWKVGCS